MHLIKNSWPQCKHMQGQRVKWLEQNFILLKSTLNSTQTSALQLYTSGLKHKWVTFLMNELIFCIFQAAPLRHFYFVCAPYKGDLPTQHDSLLPRTCPMHHSLLGALGVTPQSHIMMRCHTSWWDVTHHEVCGSHTSNACGGSFVAMAFVRAVRDLGVRPSNHKNAQVCLKQPQRFATSNQETDE